MNAAVPPRVCGLDISLTATGIAAPDTNALVLRPSGLRGPHRMCWIRDTILNLCAGADVVVVEGFAYARANKAHDIGGVGWIVRVALWEAGITYVDVPPTVLKRYATGRGNADKQAMQMAAAKRLGYDDDRPDDNAVDAMWLRAIAMDAYGHPLCQVPQAQRDAAVKALTWPRLRKEAA